MKQDKKEVRRFIPWWGYLIIAIISYCSLKYLLPHLLTDPSPSLLDVSATLAPILTIIFLVLAANGLYADSVSSDEELSSGEEE